MKVINSITVHPKRYLRAQERPYALHSISQTLPLYCIWSSLVQFGPVWSDWQWPFLVHSRKITKHFLIPCLSPPGDWWRDVFGFVPAGSVSSSSTLQIFWGANHLWWLLCPLACPLSHFHWLLHVKDSRMSTGMFQGWCWTLSRASLLFPRQKRNWN